MASCGEAPAHKILRSPSKILQAMIGCGLEAVTLEIWLEDKGWERWSQLLCIYGFAKALHFAKIQVVNERSNRGSCDPLKSSPQILKNKSLQRASLESEALEILNWQEFLWALKVICWKRTYSIWFYTFLPNLHLSSNSQLFSKAWTSPLNRPLSLEEEGSASIQPEGELDDMNAFNRR